MIKKMIVIVFFLCLGISYSYADEVFDDLKKYSDTTNFELICLIFVDMGNCPTCYDRTRHFYNSLLSEYETTPFLTIGVVNVKRERELNLFRTTYSWSQPAIAKSDKVRKSLNLFQTEYIVIIDKDFNIVFKTDLNSMKENFDYEMRRAMTTIGYWVK